MCLDETKSEDGQVINFTVTEVTDDLSRNKSKIDDLESQVEELRRIKEDLESNMESSDSNVNRLREKILQLESNCTNAENERDKHVAEILTLKEAIGGFQTTMYLRLLCEMGLYLQYPNMHQFVLS